MVKQLTLLFFFFTISVFSQTEISFRQLSVLDGLSQNSAVSIAQDENGFLWIATQDGLNKYDGYNFEIFPYQFEDITKSNHSYLGKVYCFSDSSVWIIPADKSLHQFEKKNNSFKKKSTSFPVASFLTDHQNNLWFGSYASGLFFEGKSDEKASPVSHPHLNKATLFDLKENASKKIIVAGTGVVGEVDSFTKKFTSYLRAASTINFSSIAEDSSALLWIGTYGNGVWVKSPTQSFLQPISKWFPSILLPDHLNVQSVFVDSKNRIWIATYGEGLYLISSDRNKLTHFKYQKQNARSIHYNDVLCIFEDYSGTLWFGTDGGGMSYYDAFLEKFTPFLNAQTQDHVSIDVVRSITKDKNNVLWIGTSGKGLTRFDSTTAEWKTFTTHNLPGLRSNRIMSLHADAFGKLWVGTQDEGLHILQSKDGLTSILKASPSGPHSIWQIFKDRKNQMWLATQDMGLVSVDGKGEVIRSYDFNRQGEEERRKKSIRTLREGGGYLWLGTDHHGLIRFNPKTGSTHFYQTSSSENALSSNQIKSLFYQEKTNLLWIGTNGKGLDVLDIASGKFKNFSEQDGLANNVIYGILSDSNSNLWLSSNKGITKFSMTKNFASKPSIVNFSNYDGLATEFNTGAYFQSESGELYFGSLEGFYSFKPELIKTNTISPKTKITKVDVFSKPLAISESVRLSHKENTLTFHFAALQFSLSKKNQYKYRLFPLDEKWNISESVPFARYTNLAPGNYTFEVVSANYDGFWSTESDTFSFVILKPWYATTIAFIVYSILFILFLYWMYIYFNTKLNYRLKQEEAEQWRAINNYKTKLFSDLSHEIRTPLTLMSIPLQQQISNPLLPENIKKELESVSVNKDRIINLVDQLHDLTQVELGTKSLQVSEGDLYFTVSSLIQSFVYAAHEKQIELKSKLSIKERAWYSEDMLLKIITNLLSNAVKFCPQGGLIYIEATLSSSSFFEVIIQNDIDKPIEHPHRLFDRFYRENSRAEGSGIGLSLAKELAELHKGTLTFDGRQNKKAFFKLELSLDQSNYSTEEQISITGLTGNPIKDSSDSAYSLLLVEDHDDLRAALVGIFKTSYVLYEASDGLQALELAKRKLPDLVISDIMMPKMDGLELCHALKTSALTSHIPVLLLTAKADERAEWSGISEGADGYIKKPFHVDLLRLRVKKLIESRQLLREKYKNAILFKPTDLVVSTTEMKFMEKLQTVLNEKIKDCNFDVSSFCEFMGMSRMQLHRKLKAVTGQNTSDFIKSNRLKVADSLLLKTDLQIAEIAFLSGFNSASYFIKSYKELYSFTPSERRNQ
jgi:ligand-binding sensor domain-containing protein/signal transduction histidine kinase/DNA-binding NarL/FixJ family response regulator